MRSRCGFDGPSNWKVVGYLLDLFSSPYSEFVRHAGDDGTGVILYSPLDRLAILGSSGTAPRKANPKPWASFWPLGSPNRLILLPQ